MAMLEVKDLEVYYGMIQAIKGISFEVNQGEVVTIVGANAAGKSTLMSCISRTLLTFNGDIEFNGVKIDKMKPEDIVLLKGSNGMKLSEVVNILTN